MTYTSTSPWTSRFLFPYYLPYLGVLARWNLLQLAHFVGFQSSLFLVQTQRTPKFFQKEINKKCTRGWGVTNTGVGEGPTKGDGVGVHVCGGGGSEEGVVNDIHKQRSEPCHQQHSKSHHQPPRSWSIKSFPNPQLHEIRLQEMRLHGIFPGPSLTNHEPLTLCGSRPRDLKNTIFLLLPLLHSFDHFFPQAWNVFHPPATLGSTVFWGFWKHRILRSNHSI